MAEFKGPDGKQFLSKSEINSLIENCQKGFITDGKPIPNYEAKILAVLNNPEEVAQISTWKSRAAGIWRAIQDPLSSTAKGSPEILAEVKVPFEEMPAADRQILSDLASIKETLGENAKIFHDRPGFQKSYERLKDMVIDELNTSGELSKIRAAVRDNITKQNTDIQKMINALGEK